MAIQRLADQVQIENLALLDIQDDRAILAVCAANSLGDSVHRLAPPSVSHTLTRGDVQSPVILEFVRERIGRSGVGL